MGTFGKFILIYCYNEFDERYELRRDIMLKHSIMGLLTCNLTLNCTNDLIILTLNGIHIWQYEPDVINNLINQKYNQNEIIFDNYLKYLNHKTLSNEVTKL